MEPSSDNVPSDGIPSSLNVRRRLLGLGIFLLLAIILTGYLSGIRVRFRSAPVHRVAVSAHETVTVTLEQRFQVGTRWRDLGGRHMWRELKVSYVPPAAGGAEEARTVLKFAAPFADQGGYDMVAIEQRSNADGGGLPLSLSRVWRFERDSAGRGWRSYH